MTNNWLDLAPPYFAPVCHRLLDAYFEAEGFGTSKDEPSLALAYQDGRTFVTLSYWLEDSPRFAPSVAIGLAAAYLPPDLVCNQVGLWRAISDDAAARKYGSWRFSSAQELEAVLGRIRAELLDVYARPLWRDVHRLAALIESQSAELVAAHAGELLRRQQQAAEAAFRAGRYAQARDLYLAIGIDRLSPVEEKRLAIASTRTNPAAPDP